MHDEHVYKCDRYGCGPGGGFQCSLINCFNRAFASITRDIRDIEMIEELDLDANVSVDRQLPFDGYYVAGLHTLSEAILAIEMKTA